MGLETRCHVVVDGADGRRDDADAKVELEGEGLIVRGPARARVPRASITSLSIEGDTLVVTHAAGVLRLTLGDAAAKWMQKIQEGPKSRAHKLGAKPGMRAMLIEVNDPTIGRELVEAGVTLLDEHVAGRDAPLDLVLVEVQRGEDLARITELAVTLGTAALWVVHPNGTPEVGDVAIFAVAKRAGLVATKVMAFSAGMSAERLSVAKSK